MLEYIETYNLSALLGQFNETENIYINSTNQNITIHMGGLEAPIKLLSNNSLEAFELKERSRNLIIQIYELRTIIVIESITKKGEPKSLPKNDPKCRIYKAIMSKRNYELVEEEKVKMPASILYVAGHGLKNNGKYVGSHHHKL